MAKKKRKFIFYTPEEKFSYHTARDEWFDHYGLKHMGPKHSYSGGFVDGFCDGDSVSENLKAVKEQYGKRSAKAYAFGVKRGRAEGKKYFKKTGKQPWDLRVFPILEILKNKGKKK